MKKLCTRCSCELNIAQRQCTTCGAFNPFYIASYKPREEVKLTVAEFETAPPVAEEPEQKQVEKAPFEELVRIRLEAEKNMQQEILRVKSEAEQRQQQTANMVNEVRQELHHIDEENKRLKQEVEILSRNRTSESTEAENAEPAIGTKYTEGKVLKFVLALSVAMGLILLYLFFSIAHNATKTEVKPATATPVKKETPATQASMLPATSPNATEQPVNTDIPPVTNVVSNAPTTTVNKPATISTIIAANQPKNPPAITVEKVKSDIVGKKLSGCGITIKSTAEVTSINNLVLVQKESSGDAKYKFATTISQGTDKYAATPYIYYDAHGVFLKIDGTNCE